MPTEDLKAILTRLARERGADAAPDTQARIVSAALELFAERSYESATTQAIAQRAGVTEKTLFRHFGTKEELFKRTVYPALFKLLEPVVLLELKELVLRAQGSSFRAMIRAIVADRVRFGIKHPAVVKMVAQEVLLRPAFREALIAFAAENLLVHVVPFLERARANGEMRDLPPVTAIRMAMSVVMGYVLARTIIAPDGDWDEQRDVEALTSMILDGLATRAG